MGTLHNVGAHFVQVFVAYLRLVVLLDALVDPSKQFLDLRLLIRIHILS